MRHAGGHDGVADHDGQAAVLRGTHRAKLEAVAAEGEGCGTWRSSRTNSWEAGVQTNSPQGAGIKWKFVGGAFVTPPAQAQCN